MTRLFLRQPADRNDNIIMIDTAVVIANWNGKKFLKDCLDSLNAQTYQDFKIILIDNGSEDGSVQFIHDNYPKVEIINLKKNTGFAYPNNLGIEKAFQDKYIKYIITLNNDTKVETDFLEELVNCAGRHPSVGSIQPKVLNFFDRNIIDCVGIGIERDGTGYNCGSQEKDEGQHNKEKEIFGASAGAALYTRDALEKTKLSRNNFFDSDYFAYYEDTDLALRLKMAGFKSIYCPGAKVYHVHSGTAGNFSAFKAFYLHRNRFFTIIKDFPLFLIFKAILFSESRYLLGSLLMVKKRGRDRSYVKKEGKLKLAMVVLKAWKETIISIPKLFRKRKIIYAKCRVSRKEIKSWLKKNSAD